MIRLMLHVTLLSMSRCPSCCRALGCVLVSRLPSSTSGGHARMLYVVALTPLLLLSCSIPVYRYHTLCIIRLILRLLAQRIGWMRIMFACSPLAMAYDAPGS